MLARIQSIGFNLLMAGFCFGWPLFMGIPSNAFGVFLGLFLWPLGLFYLYRALTAKVEEDFAEGNHRSDHRTPLPVQVPHTGDVFADNTEALLRWAKRENPKWPNQMHREFANSLALYFGQTRWNGSNQSQTFQQGVNRWLRDRGDIR